MVNMLMVNVNFNDDDYYVCLVVNMLMQPNEPALQPLCQV